VKPLARTLIQRLDRSPECSTPMPPRSPSIRHGETSAAALKIVALPRAGWRGASAEQPVLGSWQALID